MWSCRTGGGPSWWWWVCGSPYDGSCTSWSARRRPVVGDPPVAHHDRAVDERRQRAELVGDQDDGRAGVLEAAERVGERLLARQVDACGRLVEHEQVGLAGQCAGDQHPLLLAAGERGDAVVATVGEADDVERVVDGGPVGARERAQQPAAGQPAGGDHLPHRGGHAGGGARALRHEADPRPRVVLGERRAEQPQLARGQRQQAGDGADERGLAGAVRAHQGHELARHDGQVDAAQDRPAADGDRAAGQLDGSHGRVHPLASSRAVRFSRIRER